MGEPATSLRLQEQKTNVVRKAFLIGGLASSLLYLLVDIAASIHWSAFYHYSSQGFSELLANGAPTRAFVLSFGILYSALVIAFGLTVWATDKRKLSLRIVGILLIGYAVVGIVTPAFFPAPMRGTVATFRNDMHLPLTGIEVILLLASIAFGAAASGKRFRLYSIATLLVLTLCGVWGGSFAAKVAANEPTPGFGVIERGNIYGYLLWVMVLAIMLLRAEKVKSKEMLLKG